MVNEKKLKAAIAYIAERIHPGKVKLFKLLYFADFTAYAERGQSVTSETYQHFRMGPVPLTLYRDLRDGLNTYVDIESIELGMPLPTQIMHSKPDADLSVLSEEDKGILDRVIEQYGHLSGAALRDITHKEIPYVVTVSGEEIPYYLAVYRTARKPTPEEVKSLTSHPEFVNRLRQSMQEMQQSRETSEYADNQVE